MTDRRDEAPRCFVGIDTSNYTTSAAACVLTDSGEPTVIANCKVPLPVEPGARGLRQSDAVFAHTRNLPVVLTQLREILEAGKYRLSGVGISATPRDADGSYMPCFLCGVAAGTAMATGAGVPLSRVSHQSGHIMAALYSSGALSRGILGEEAFLAFHVSGGTTEAVVARPRRLSGNEQSPLAGFDVELVGCGQDLHAGQVIDRVGVMMGLAFPCGKAMEELAATNRKPLPPLKVCVREGSCHLSGLENKAAALWKETADPALVSAYVLAFIGKTLLHMTENIQAARLAVGQTCLPVVYAGGVMSNQLIRPTLSDGLPWPTYFAAPAFSADNAAGVALLCAAMG